MKNIDIQRERERERESERGKNEIFKQQEKFGSWNRIISAAMCTSSSHVYAHDCHINILTQKLHNKTSSVGVIKKKISSIPEWHPVAYFWQQTTTTTTKETRIKIRTRENRNIPNTDVNLDPLFQPEWNWITYRNIDERSKETWM